MASVHQLVKNVSSHAFSGDGSRLALCPNDNTVNIYVNQGGKWELDATLEEHDQLVTGIDWAPKTNRLVTCSEDRNAYVWTENADKTWKPTLVILRINRAATSVKWSPNENKFAVASGAKLVSVCYFEEENDWWVSKHIKKHRSTVLDVCWHPNNLLLMTSSTDYKCRIFSAAVKGVDSKPQPGSALAYMEALPAFGEEVAIFNSANGWVECARFSPSGNSLAFVAHDSTITFVDTTKAQNGEQKLLLKGLPLVCLLFLDENTVVAAGHERAPQLFKKNGASWAHVKSLDTGKSAGGAAAAGGSAPKAMGMWQNKVDRGTEDDVKTSLSTTHQSVITAISPYKGSYATTGLDGLLCLWPKP